MLLKDIICFRMTLAYKLHVLQQPLRLAVQGGCCLPEQTEKHIAEGEFCTVAWQDYTRILYCCVADSVHMDVWMTEQLIPYTDTVNRRCISCFCDILYGH